MKRKVTTIFAALLISLSSNAQLTGIDSTKMMYDSIPTSFFPSEILHNRSPFYLLSLDTSYTASPYSFPGIIPAPSLPKLTFSQIWEDMYHSSVNPNLIPDNIDFQERDSLQRIVYDAPVAAMHVDFHQIVPGAVDSGFLWFDTIHQAYKVMPDTVWIDKPNNIYHLVSNPDSLAELAFSEHEVFIGSITNSVFYGQGNQISINFGFPSSLFVSNKGQSPTYVEMDFADGNGFQSWGFNQSKIITYHANSANDNYEKILRLRLFYGQKVVEARMTLMVMLGVVPADTVIYASSLPLQCSVSTGGYFPGEGKISIRYGNSQKKLLKPVIFVEAFDNGLKPYGNVNFEALAAGKIFGPNNKQLYPQTEDLKNLFDTLNLLGYDIIYVDPRNGMDYIQANALNLIKTIEWANEELQANGSFEKLIVLGASMGGLISRYALAKMEKEGCCHNTRIYGTYDTPHNAAFIPLGVQASVRHLRNRFGWVDFFKDEPKVTPPWDQVLMSPGARQMLYPHLDPSGAVLRSELMDELNSLGHPRQCRRIAIVNGSEQGLTNHITHPEKAFFTGPLPLPLPISHYIGSDGATIASNLIGTTAPFYPFMFNTYAESNPNNIIFERNNFLSLNGWFSTYFLAQSILAAHGASYLLQSLTKRVGYFNLLLMPICNAIIIATQNTTNSVLQRLHSLNSPVQYQNSVYSPNSLHYSESPGSSTDVPKTVAESFFGLVDLITPEHTFVTSVSALDMDTNDLYLNIEDIRVSNTQYTPFDVYWAPGRDENDENMMHVEANLIINHWIIEQLELDNELRSFSGAHQYTLDEYYNFGNPTANNFGEPLLKNLYSVDIIDGGRLYVNKAGTVGFANSPRSNVMGDRYSCYTGSSCDQSVVRVFSGGKFELGDDAFGNRAEMHFLRGSVLEILPGGKLVINDHSRLIIDEGATLIYHPGAIIELNGEDAILEIKGKVEVKDNAVFTFTSQDPSEYGRIVFNQRQWDGGNEIPVTEYWEIGDNAQMVFEGSVHHDDVLIECKRSLRTSAGSSKKFSLIKISRGAIHIHENYNANLTADSLVFEFTTVDLPPTSQGKHKGIQLWGMSNRSARIRHIHFYNGSLGLSGFQHAAQHPLYMHDCNFAAIDTALYFEGGCFDLLRCNFVFGERGIKAINSSGQSKIQNCDFYYATKPSSIESDVSASLEVRGCNFYGTLFNSSTPEPALHNNFTDVEMSCSMVQSYHTAVSTKNASLNLSRGYNRFYPSSIGIEMDNATGLFLHQGENVFAGNSSFDINGTLTSNAQLVLVNSKINASQNSFQSGTSGFNTNMLLGSSLIILDAPSTYVTQFCPEGVISHNPYGDLIGHTPSEIEIDINGIQPFSFALIEATNSVFGNEGYEAYLYQALTDVQAIMDQVTAEIDSLSRDYDKMAYQIGFSMMLNILRKAYHYGVLEAVAADPNATLNSYLQSMSSYINTIIALLPNDAYYDENVAIWEITRAHVFRLGQYHQLGLDALQSISGAISPKTESRKNYWNCVMGWEAEMLQGNIAQDEFYMEFEICADMYSPFVDFPDNEVPVSHDYFTPKDDLSIYPNPAQSHIYVKMDKIARPDELVDVTITSIDGRVLLQRKEYASYLIGVNVENLAQGSYTLSITTPHKTHNGKFVIVR
jgi:hypothetical protein